MTPNNGDSPVTRRECVLKEEKFSAELANIHFRLDEVKKEMTEEVKNIRDQINHMIDKLDQQFNKFLIAGIVAIVMSIAGGLVARFLA